MTPHIPHTTPATDTPRRPQQPLQAVLFDMDGTLVDTERLWWEAVEHVAAGLGRSLTEADEEDVLGRPVEHTAEMLSRATGAPFAEVAADLHREFADRVRSGVVARPGALRLLDALAADGVPTALVTASPRAIADLVVEGLGAGRFAVTVTADDTPRTKPAPDPYLAACRALGVEPASCVAVEDTRTGVSSAEAAGCAVLAVPSLAPIAAAPGRTVRESLEDVTPAGLRDMITTRDLADPPDPRELRVMSWNLWYGGTKVQHHREKQLKIILASGVDVVGLQETYGTAARELAEALGWEYHQAGENLGVISRFPITGRLGAADPGFYGATGVRVTLGADQDVVLWSAHLDYTPYGPYEASFDGLAAPELAAHESVRLGQMREILTAMAPDLAARDTTPVLLVGDFNAPSHLDRDDSEWPVTRAAEESGLRDSYREAHPDPVGSPGHTWSPVHTEHEDGSGRPEPQDRIDYVLYAGAGLRVLDSRTLVTGTPRTWPDVEDNDWPSDHAAVITTFSLGRVVRSD
ncbi:HAD-IA family hydrolase [Streptomyces phaeochromogenes]|uniref:HAD-IA family hydrolase n=1 Tax=Streptomyces phaeochromogenes TaxID=1923 RepID=UPI0036BB22A0